jgi:hypothetical protein
VKKILFLLCLGLLAFSWYLGTAFLSYRALEEAVHQGDALALERLVDFPSVRASLKEELKQRLQQSGDSGAQQDPWARVLGSLANKLLGSALDPLVDLLVTPSSLADLLRERESAKPKSSPGESPPSWQDPIGKLRLFRAFSFPRFGVFCVNRPEYRLWFRWNGFRWRLVRVELKELPSTSSQ